MQSLPTIIKNKKVLLIGGIVIILIILITAIATESRPTPSTPHRQTSVPNEQTNPFPTFSPTSKHITRPVIKPTVTPGYIAGWILSDNDVYTFQFPSDWELKRTLFDGGQTVLITPNDWTEKTNIPHWSITISKTDPNSPIINKEDIFAKSSGFRKSMTTLSGNPAIKLSGTLSPNNPKLYETHIILQQEKYSYRIVYKYPPTQSKNGYEAIFQKITDTVAIE